MNEIVSKKIEQKEPKKNITIQEQKEESSKQINTSQQNNQNEIVSKKKWIPDRTGTKHTEKTKKKMSKSRKNNINSVKHAMYSELRAEYCDDCHIKQKCPRFQQNSLCAYSDALKRYPKWEKFKRNPDVIIKRIYDEIKDQIRILEKNKFSNLKHGDKLNKYVEQARKDMIANLKLIHDMSTGGEKIKMKVETNPVDKIFADVLNKRKKRQEAEKNGREEESK